MKLFGTAWQADDFHDDRLGAALEKMAKSDLTGIYHVNALEAFESRAFGWIKSTSIRRACLSKEITNVRRWKIPYYASTGCHRRYHAPLARTISVGKAAPEVIDLAKIATEALEAALNVVKPGVYAEEPFMAFKDTLKKYGKEKESRIGYSIGVNYPPSWTENNASIRLGDKTVLQPNMCFHFIPGMYYKNYGVTISQSIRVTETGYETLTKTPRELIIK